MKTLFSLLLLTITLLAARPAAVSYRAVPAASQLTWTGHAEVGSYAPSGTLQLRSGAFTYDGTRLSQGRFVVDMNTLQHETPQMQQHLRGEDFFDVQRFPTAEFVLREATVSQATGQLTIKGVSETVIFPLTLSRGAAGELRVRGTLNLDRTRFGIRYNSTSFFANLGDQAIRNDFQLTFDVVARPDNAAASR